MKQKTQTITEVDLTRAIASSELTAMGMDPKRPCYSSDAHSGKIILDVNYDASIKLCHFTQKRFLAPLPLAFFYEGDRTKPVWPSHPLGVGFTTYQILLHAICLALSDEESIKTVIPHTMKAADWIDQCYVMDRQCGFDEASVDDYFVFRFGSGWSQASVKALQLKTTVNQYDRIPCSHEGEQPMSRADHPAPLVLDWFKADNKGYVLDQDKIIQAEPPVKENS